MIRVALIADSELTENSGIGRYQRMMFRFLPMVAEDISYTVVSRRSMELPNSIRNIVHDDSGESNRGTWFWAESLRDFFEVNRFDIVHLLFHAPFHLPSGIRFVGSLMDCNPLVRGRGHPLWRRILFRRYIKSLLRHASGVIVPSAWTFSELLSRWEGLEGKKIVIVELGGDAIDDNMDIHGNSVPKSGDRAELSGSEKDKPFLLAVNILDSWKEPIILCRIMEEITSRGLPHNLLIAAGNACGDDIGRFKRNCEKVGISKRIKILRKVNDRDLVELYRKANALLVVSKFEGFCLPAAEAMRTGCPVLYVKSGALPGVVDGGGIGFGPDEFSFVADVVDRIQSEKEFAEGLRTRALSRGLRFSWRTTAKDTVSFYREILRGEKG